MDSKRLADEILVMDGVVRFVGIIDCKENTLMSKMNKGKHSILTSSEEEKFAANLETIMKINQEFDMLLGKTSFVHVIKERIHLLIYHMQNLIIYVSCEPDASMQKIFRVSNNIERIIFDFVSV